MERETPDKLFAEDTLPYPNSEDGEKPGDKPDPSCGKHAADTGPLEHTPSPEDVYEPGGGNASPGADIEDELSTDMPSRTQ